LLGRGLSVGRLRVRGAGYLRPSLHEEHEAVSIDSTTVEAERGAVGYDGFKRRKGCDLNHSLPSREEDW
jgi:hypothetical protein